MKHLRTTAMGLIGATLLASSFVEPSALAASPTNVIASVSDEAGIIWQTVPTSEWLPVDNQLSILNSYIQFSSVGFQIAAPDDVLQKVPATQLDALHATISQINSYVAEKKLTMTANGIAIPTRHSKLLSKWSGEHGYIETHWYGLEVHLDAYAASKVINGAWAGSGSAALAAVLGGGPWAVPVSAALATGAGVVGLCQASNGSVTVYFLTLTSPLPAAVCNPFA